MAITALVENGVVTDTGANASSTSATGNTSTTDQVANEEMFLNLLVAEMQYQDPLEPTSNTEWISQYATFTQVEQQTAMQESLKEMQASSLVGQQVIMKTTNEVTGETSYYSGVVDYMYVEEGEVYLSVNNNLYSIDDLDTVVNADYMDAITCSQTFEAMMEALPSEEALTTADEPLITAAREAYDSMTDYQKTFVDSDLVSTLESLESKMKALLEAEGTTSETSDTESTEETSTDATEDSTEETTESEDVATESTTEDTEE